MLKAIRQTGIVNQEGKIEIQTENVSEGTEVEVIILINTFATDTTDYLMSSQINHQDLLAAKKRVENREDLVIITPEEWEKYSI